MHNKFALTLQVLSVCTSGLLLASATAAAADYDCMIEARKNIEIRSPVEAIIESVKVRRGDYVKRGQILVTLESGPERAAYELAQSRAKMQGEIKAAEARVDLAQKKMNRADDLFKRNFVSANARDEAEAELRLASEESRRTRENQVLAVHDARRAREMLAMRTIRSPFNGVVVEVLLNPGEFGATSIRDPIMKLAEIDPLHVEVVLPVSLYGKIKPGQQAIVTPESPIGGRLKTTVHVIDRVLDAASGTFGVRMLLPNPKGEIPAGLRCKADFS
jgi:RND family efflux transporter MFP subunit